MKEYGQACGLAKALDVVGERWSLLIVRELLIRGSCRYTDIKQGLPGIATNLLAERLRELAGEGLIESEAAPPPIATTLYRLSDRGRELEPALLLLGRWGSGKLAQAKKSDVMQGHWLLLPLKMRFAGRSPEGAAFTLQIRCAGEALYVAAKDRVIEMGLGTRPNPDATVSGDPQVVLSLLMGHRGLSALPRNAQVSGDRAALEQFLGRAD